MKKYYYATIAWDGLVVDGKRLADFGEYIISRDTLEDLVEGVEEYLIKWKGREAYLDLAAEEYKDPDRPLIHRKEYTEFIKKELKKRGL
tara:strand:+ start:151 stop:417 length:267 start_codon:yes stop_codon:yes gene_type:complete